jgi:hypothetical protein
MRKKILLFAGLACTVLVLAPTAATASPAPRPAIDTPPGYKTVSTKSISLPNLTNKSATAKCPAGTVVLSGGAFIASSSVQTGINASGPAGSTGWTAFVNNFSGAATTFNVYAVCATKPAGYAQASSGSVGNDAGTQTSVSANCPSSSDLVTGGGAAADGRIMIDMTSSYPGAPTDWVAAVSNASPVNENINAVAVCVSNTATGFSDYALQPSAPAPDPSKKQQSITEACIAGMPVGGGNQSSNITSVGVAMRGTRPFGPAWRAGENNNSPTGTHLTAWAICA